MEHEQLFSKTREHIAEAIRIAGSAAALADAVGQPRQAVDRWRRTGRVPAHHCIPIENETKGQITRYDLRPDVFGQAPTQQ